MTKPPAKEPLARSQISDDTPLRLADAARLAFPAGGMTAASLRREAAKGRLTIERIAGKDFTTLAAIERMRELCRVPPKAPASTSSPRAATPPVASLAPPDGSSEMVPKCTPQDALQAKLQKLIKPSPTISERPSSRRARNVISMPSRSPTS
ncbi:excisionase [Methylobacterium sp. 17Sr1-1]|uniref:excisionase n=1 Tax=Methylobacterium sp. 17Sr1-1 TaxID=2202826 RepID=UPI001FDEAFA6|nr:excisionase [Methylobacterium sp. 17Sr1-1]